MSEGTLSGLYRHPLKGVGCEPMDEVDLNKGKGIAFDRRWAVAHGDAESVEGWAAPKNFVTQSYSPRLAQTKVKFSQRNHMLELSHPDRPDLAIQIGTPDGDDALSEWIEPLVAGTLRAAPPYLVYEMREGGFTDFEDTHIAIGSDASLRALGEKAGTTLQHERFRMNLWIEGFAPYAELDWVDREVEIGEARLKIIGRDKRCSATTANPKTGHTDVQVPKLLHAEFGHMDFGVYAQVVKTGPVRVGDPVRVL